METMSEKQIEQRLVKAVKEQGGIAPKWVSPGTDGMPDRLLLLPGGRAAFVEVKAPGKTLRPLQAHRKKQLEALGFPVFVLNDPKQVKEILDAIQSP